MIQAENATCALLRMQARKTGNGRPDQIGTTVAVDDCQLCYADTDIAVAVEGFCVRIVSLPLTLLDLRKYNRP